MTAGDIVRVLRSPGRLVLDPTDLGVAFPHGGTEVGKTRLAVLQPVFAEGFRIMSEGLGEATDVLEPERRAVFAAFVRGWDDDAAAQLFDPHYAAGTPSGHAVLSEPGTAVVGESRIARAVKALYVPDDPLHSPAVLVYRGLPGWAPGAELLMQRGEEFGVPFALECIRDASNRIYQVGLLSDLTL